MSVGANIRRIRQEKHISQIELAQKAGITQSMLCQIERETKNPSLQVGRELALLLGCTVDDLLKSQ